MPFISKKISAHRMPPMSAFLMFFTVFALIPTLLPSAYVSAQVPVHINSGDPAFPFPQFLPYAHPNGDTLYNLSSKNPEGVPHAEMEKTIRDAYQIMMNRADYTTVRGVERVGGPNGTRYIAFHSEPRCSEGDGYAMLAAAMMADKVTFDGLWLYVHDFSMNKVIRYGDGSAAPDYRYSMLPGVYNGAGDNSAADGDFDIAMALMIAHMQWGDLMGINDSRGNPISYKNDFIKVIKGLTDTLSFRDSNFETMLSGSIGLDGFFKGGDSWAELTGWSQHLQNLVSIGVHKRVEQAGPTNQYFDYNAPAYFRQFADYLKQQPNAAAYGWNISQFERAEASSDWLMGQLIGQNPRHIPFAGDVNYPAGGTPVFGNIQGSEDMRAPWRTILNYVWHGNPVNSWNPTTHQVIRNTSNTYQRDAGQRFARFLWDRRQSPWNYECETIIGEGTYWGPGMLREQYTVDGRDEGTFRENWIQGTGSPSAVTSQDFNLMAEMYRQAEIEWNVSPKAGATPDDPRYLGSRPFYFHGFFRLLGMMVLTGNHHAPLNMTRQANMKVYLDVDKTYAFENDPINYTIDYRNYGAEDAAGVQIINRLHSDMVYISSTGGGVYDPSGHLIRWNIGAVPGFKTATGIAPTKGTVSFQVIIPNANLKRYENQAEITATNGPGWVSNDYPNVISSVMKRNGVDIAKRALRINHSVYRDTINPGMTAVYTIDIENSAEAGWLNGGRPGVNFSYAHNRTQQETDGQLTFMIRAFHDAQEAYIDYGNYRVSYFMFDNNYRGLVSQGAQNGWGVRTDILYVPEAEQANFRLINENVTPGQDEKGRWNQRLILQVADPQNRATDTNWGTMAAPTPFLLTYRGMDQRIHRGIDTEFKAVWAIFGGNYASRNWGGDWSFNSGATISNTGNDAMENWGHPITPDFTESYDPDYQGKPAMTVHRKLCAPPPAATVDNILIEEWDGYTWRRVFGNGPIPGRDVNNVVIRDTIDPGVTFVDFINPVPPNVRIEGNVITWTIDTLQVGETGRLQYSVRADDLPGTANRRIVSNAWASADRESPTPSRAILVVTLDSLPPPPPELTTMYKYADKGAYLIGDTVTYTIAYKQTHGSTVTSTSASQWGGSGANIAGETISLSTSDADMYFRPSYGKNMTLTGSFNLTAYNSGPFYIYARGSETNPANRVVLDILRDNIEGNESVVVTVTSNGQNVGSISASAAFSIASIDYKFVFKEDSLFLWIVDTTTTIPYQTFTGIADQAGYAGFNYETNNWGTASLSGWTVHSELAYDVTIRDTIPSGLRYIDGSAAGQINTGSLVPKALPGTESNGVITWFVTCPTAASCDTPLGANDSLTVTFRAAVVTDVFTGNRIINTAYTDLRGKPDNSIGAQVVSRYGTGTPDNPIIDTTGFFVRVRPAGCIFNGSVTVTLESSVPGTAIYYTRNDSDPDPYSLATQRYDGPLAFNSLTTLRAAAFTEDFDQSPVVRHIYEPLKTVPVRSAFFFDDAGSGLAVGIKLILSPDRTQEPNMAVIRRHQNLIGLPGMPVVIDSLHLSGDTITMRFRGSPIDPPLNASIVISEPDLPSEQYTNAHGYLAEGTMTIIDGVAPVITDAVYRLSLSGIENGNAVPGFGDTLEITFNKYALTISQIDPVSPFVLSGSDGTYEFTLQYVRHNGYTIIFAVTGIGGANPSTIPTAGDMVRIKVDEDHITTIYGVPQRDPNNKAVPLRIVYPDLDYIVRAGPNPFTDVLNIYVYVDPYLPPVFEALDPRKPNGTVVRIFDRLGNLVAVTGKNLTVAEPEVVGGSPQYKIIWDGTNIKGRKAATGTYLIHVSMPNQENGKRVVRRKVYLHKDGK